LSRIASRTWSSSFLGRCAIRVSGRLDLLKEQHSVMMVTGSAKSLDTGYRREEFCNVQTAGCFYRTFLYNRLVTLPMWRGSVEA